MGWVQGDVVPWWAPWSGKLLALSMQKAFSGSAVCRKVGIILVVFLTLNDCMIL